MCFKRRPKCRRLFTFEVFYEEKQISREYRAKHIPLAGAITVGCVLLITVFLIVSGIPAIKEIGIIDFLFGKEWASTAAEPKYGILPFILTSIYGTAGAILIGCPWDSLPQSIYQRLQI